MATAINNGLPKSRYGYEVYCDLDETTNSYIYSILDRKSMNVIKFKTSLVAPQAIVYKLFYEAEDNLFNQSKIRETPLWKVING